MDCSHQAPLSVGILQQWVAISSSRGSFWPRDQTHVSLYLLHWQGGSLPLVPPGKPSRYCTVRLKMFYFLYLFSMYIYWCEKYHKPITVQYYVTNCVSWAPELTLLDLQTNWTYECTLRTELISMKGTHYKASHTALYRTMSCSPSTPFTLTDPSSEQVSSPGSYLCIVFLFPSLEGKLAEPRIFSFCSQLHLWDLEPGRYSISMVRRMNEWMNECPETRKVT